MGADIHIQLEKKYEGEWVGVPLKYIRYDPEGRCYDRFAKMASVRGDGLDPKGIPKDASLLTKMRWEQYDDLHSPSWLSLWDACEIYADSKDPICIQHCAEGYFGVYISDIDNYRIVFWFDS